MILSVPNTLDGLPTTQYSYLTSAVTSGGTVVPVRNINPFSASRAIQLGKTGESQSEILLPSASTPAGTALNTVGTLVYNHNLDTPIFNIFYDKIIFKRSTDGTTGTATALGTVGINPASFYTEYNDTQGLSIYGYKTQYYNSVTLETSTESDWYTFDGPSFYSLFKIKDRAKGALYNASYLTADPNVLNDWVNEWIEVMTNAAIKVNKGYSIGTTNVSFGTAGYGTITTSNFKIANKVEITNDGVSYINSQEIPESEYSAGDTYSSIYPHHAWVGDNTFQIIPAGSGGTARITYSKLADRLVNETDELPYSLRSYTTCCIEYILYKAFDNDLKRDYATDHYQKFDRERSVFMGEITPRDQTGVKTIQFTETTTGMNEDISLSNEFFI